MQRILVAYASTFGSTAEVAEAIGEALHRDDTAVDVRPVVDVNDLVAYDAAIVASGIYNGTWLPEAIAFLRAFAPTLQDMPVAYVAVCMMLYRETPHRRSMAATYMQTVRVAVPQIVPVSIGLFAGKLRYRNLALMERILFLLTSRLPPGDYRDWTAIRDWAAEIRPLLVGATE